MGDLRLTRADPAEPASNGVSRTRVLEALQRARGPVVVTELAEQVGLHPNTARFHLDALVRQGLAEQAKEERELPGRPRSLYTATAQSVGTGQRSYQLLAEILTSYLATQTRQPARAALAAGERWGRFLTDRPEPFEAVSAASGTSRLVQLLDEIGFAPEEATTKRRHQILLHHCPFREAAEKHREVVCSIHLGLMRGALAELAAPVSVERLDPFVEPDLCVTHLVAGAR